jgi:hypothetical protein
MRISTPGIGRPTDPGLRAPTSGFTQVTGEHSVGPSPSSTGTPKRCSKADITATGMAAPPLTQARTPDQAATSESSRRSSRPNMLGTPRKRVAPWLAIASRPSSGAPAFRGPFAYLSAGYGDRIEYTVSVPPPRRPPPNRNPDPRVEGQP